MTKRLHTNRLFSTEAGNKNPVWIMIIEYFNIHKNDFQSCLKFSYGIFDMEIEYQN